MNEDERGITPANVTSITVERPGRDWRVIIEQGNGDVIKVLELTDMERTQLACMLSDDSGAVTLTDASFVDVSRGESI